MIPSASPTAAPPDPTRGLRSSAGRRVLALAANPHVAADGTVLDQLVAALLAQGLSVLVVDAAATSPAAPEIAAIDLRAAIDFLCAEVAYLPARGLPRAHVDTRGSAAGLLDRLADAAPACDAILLHADAADLARLLEHGGARPVILAADHPEAVKHAYAACKLLAQRRALTSFDLLLAADPASRRIPAIVTSVAGCAAGFVGAELQYWALVDPAARPTDAPALSLTRLVAAQLALAAAARPADAMGREPPRSINRTQP